VDFNYICTPYLTNTQTTMKLKTLLLFLSSLMLLSFSCTNDEKEEPTPPKAINKTYPDDSIDVNNDGIKDFVIYSIQLQTMDEPSSFQTNMRKISPLNGNQIEYLFGESFNGGYVTSCFFDEGHIIYSQHVGEDTGGPFQWSEGSPTLISINTSNGVLDNAWKIGSTKTNDFFMAVKLNNVTPSQIGWLLFEFNTLTGAYTIVDKDWTANATLKIQK
jgi:hypothetical protein